MAQQAGVRKAARGRKIPMERLERVEALMMSCAPYPAIEKELAAPPKWEIRDGKRVNLGGFGISRRQVATYIQRVEEDWAKRRDETFPDRRRKLRFTLEGLYQRCLRAGDLKTALGCIAQLSKLDGVNAPETVLVGEAPEGSLAGRDPDAVRDRVRRLLATPEAKKLVEEAAKKAASAKVSKAKPPAPAEDVEE